MYGRVSGTRTQIHYARLGKSMSGITSRNKQDFNCRLNDKRVGAERTVAGKLFHVRSSVTGNERSPTVTGPRYTIRMSVSATDLSRFIT